MDLDQQPKSEAVTKASQAADRWLEVRTLVETAMALACSERLWYVTTHASDAGIGQEAGELLGFDREASSLFSIDHWKLAAAQGDGPETDLNGTLLGSYRLLKEIGRGGMGTVYLAERADGLYQHQIAIKILQEGLSSPALITRFIQERQLLARLSHPGICRMLDGGTTAEGRPYLALEYVDGSPIDAYCEEHALDVEERLRLFLSVAAAVQAAHQQLILHLDIKPGNVLVTRQGEARLLDFGIARAVSEEVSGTEEGVSLRVLTPRYASPEQVHNGPLTVASDVYSLGLLLHKILTGMVPEAAFYVSPGKPGEAPKPLRLPSEIMAPDAARLRGDLDCILLHATDPEPQRRYQTVAALTDDIDRYLQMRPVRAHRDSFGYRWGKFLRRNRISAIISAAAAIILIVSVIAIVKAAVVARSQRAIAERRLADNRALAHSYIFDLPRQLQDIPGTVAIRHGIVERALNYLEAMSAEASSDPSLDQELAGGFYVIGQLQGGSTLPSLGDQEAGLHSLRRSMEIQGRNLKRNPDDIMSQSRVMMANTAIANILHGRGEVIEAERLHQASYQMGQAVLAAGPRKTGTKMYEVASAAWFIGVENTGDGNSWSLSDPSQGLLWFARAEDILARWLQAYPDMRDDGRSRSFKINLMASEAEALRELDRDTEAKAILIQAVAESEREPILPNSLILAAKRDAHLAYAQLLFDEGDLVGAVRASAALRPELISEMREQGVNPFILRQEASLTCWFAILDMRTGHKDRGMRELAKSLEIWNKAEKESPFLAELFGSHAVNLVDFADLPETNDDQDEALYREATRMTKQYVASHPGVLSAQLLLGRASLGLARVAMSKHHRAEALDRAREAVNYLSEVASARPTYPLPHQLLQKATLLASHAAEEASR